jgi:hypothetical protein
MMTEGGHAEWSPAGSAVPARVRATAGADLRTRGFAIESMLEPLDAVVSRTGRELEVLFMDCDDEPLHRRYTETRRPHLAGDRPETDGYSARTPISFCPARPC